MLCAKCSNALTVEDLKYKMVCDFCNDTHCLSCSKLTTSEAHVTRLSKQRILLFACEDCTPTVKNPTKAFTTVLQNQLELLKLAMEKTISDTLNEFKETYTRKLDNLNDLLNNKCDNLTTTLLESLDPQLLDKSLKPAQTAENPNKKLEKKQVPEIPSKTKITEPKISEPKINTVIDTESVKTAIASAQLQRIVNLNNDKGTTKTKKPISQPSPNRAQRHNQRTVTHNNSRPAPHKGTKENVAGLEVAATSKQPGSWIFLSGFSTRTTPDTISSYIQSNLGLKDCVCEKLKTRKDKWKSSFKLSVKKHDEEKVMNPELWPSGIIFNNFLNLRQYPVSTV